MHAPRPTDRPARAALPGGPAARPRAYRALLVGALVVGLVVSGSGAAWAWWQATANVTAAASAATVPAPTGLTCQSSVVLFQDDPAVFTITAAAAPTGATRSFILRFTPTTGAAVELTTTGTSRSVTASDLGTIWNQSLTVTVRTVLTFTGGTAWQSTGTGGAATTGSTTLGYRNLDC